MAEPPRGYRSDAGILPFRLPKTAGSRVAVVGARDFRRQRGISAGSAGVRVQHADINANDNNSQYMLFCRVGGRAMMQQQQHRPAKQLN